MKTKIVWLAAVMFLAFSVAAFAQTTFQVGSTPVTAISDSGQTEKVGSITFTPIVSSSPAVNGTITINYGLPITGPLGNVQITGTLSGYFALNVFASDISSGKLVLNVTGGTWPQGSVTISGVRVSTVGTKLTSLVANISATENAILAGQSAVTVVSSIAKSLAYASISDAFFVARPASINAVTQAVTQTTSGAGLKAAEGFLTAFGVKQADDPSQTISPMIRFTLDKLPPKGVTITFPLTANTVDPIFGGTVVEKAFQLAKSDGTFLDAAQVIAFDSESLSVYYRVATSTSQNQSELIKVDFTVAVDAFTAAKPLPTTSISATATMAPIGTAFDPLFFFPVALSKPIPRYAESLTNAVEILRIIPGSTTLMIPYATTAVGYDTGIAIANTTTDPGTSGMGLTGAVKQAGTMKFYFYPQTGNSFSYTTAADSPGSPAMTGGQLATGRTYAVLLSQLLAAAGAPADFTGYIVIVCNFTNAHGQYFVSDFEAFTNGAQMLVISTARTTTPEASGQ